MDGATEVAVWQVLGGPTPNELKVLARAPHAGFETPIELALDAPFVAVGALDPAGSEIGRSEVARVA